MISTVPTMLAIWGRRSKKRSYTTQVRENAQITHGIMLLGKGNRPKAGIIRLIIASIINRL